MGAHELVLRDVQSVLRRSLNLNSLTVEEVSTSSLVPPGENYGSTILKVRILVKPCENEAPEEWHLIAKMLPPTEFQRVMFDCNYTVPKEIFLYEELFPYYQKLEKEFGIEPVFDILPKFYGARLSLKEEVVTVDEDSVILLENLKEAGYYVADRKLGLDLDHAKFAVRAIARFHVLGIAMKQHKPEQFEIIKFRAKCMANSSDEFQDVMSKILTQIEADPGLSDYENACRQALSNNWMDVIRKTPEEPWSTIIHSDFWVNNFLFHKDANNKVDSIKFVDFQNYLFLSPLQELVFLLGISLNIDVEKNHFQELVDLYYQEFIYWLERMKCDITPFSRDNFDRQLAHDGKIEFMHCTFMLKILTTEVDRDTDSSQIKDLMLMQGNGRYMERLGVLIRSFVKRGWI